jgi:hypothetical protein
VSVGVKVAVTTALPTEPKVRVLPDSDATLPLLELHVVAPETLALALLVAEGAVRETAVAPTVTLLSLNAESCGDSFPRYSAYLVPAESVGLKEEVSSTPK